MRHIPSAGKRFEDLASRAPDDIREISRDPFLGDQINKLYYAYPWFLLECLDEHLRKKLYLPWEQPGRFEALRLHLALTHHWRPEDVRSLEEHELLELLRPELMAIRLDPADVQSVVDRLDNLLDGQIHQDLLKRSQSE